MNKILKFVDFEVLKIDYSFSSYKPFHKIQWSTGNAQMRDLLTQFDISYWSGNFTINPGMNIVIKS